MADLGSVVYKQEIFQKERYSGVCGKEDSWHPIMIWFKFLEGLKVYEITENSPVGSFYKWGSNSQEGASGVSGGARQGRWVKIIE